MHTIFYILLWASLLLSATNLTYAQQRIKTERQGLKPGPQRTNTQSTNSVEQQQSASISLSAEEQELYRLVMEYRKSKGLPAIPLSKSMTFVAQTHAHDLAENPPNSAAGCNMHSWSDKGNWKPCCYTDDHAQAACMWEKPRELTKYPGYGFEVSYWSGGKANAAGALAAWKGSSGHNQVIINEGIWAKYNWQAIGIGIVGQYAVMWFGKEEDPEQ
ncbi:CAP domain-containing protein [Eisenibacter elegans]|uniref:CAP domain-containing protein n=1 Tax=Eisenibacter elegans TaxID=997 RepID=UPI00042850D8|nr:CAP domain-containing protein [Eisenibacter elegans]